MKDDGKQDESAPILPRWGWTGLIGIPILAGAWLLNEAGQGWWNNTLTNVGVTSLFIIPAAFIGHSFSDWKKSVNKRTEAAETKAQEAVTEAQTASRESRAAKADVEILNNAFAVNDVKLSNIETIRDELMSEQVAEADKEHRFYADLAERGDRLSLLRVLRHGQETGLISDLGLRSPIWETGLHYRFELVDDGFMVNIEDAGGKHLDGYYWDEGEDAVSFYKQLLKAVQKLGAYQGVMTFDPTRNIVAISESLEYASRLRHQKLRMGAENVHDIIEYVDGWYITEDGMFPKGREHYLIEAHRLWSLDWEEHIIGKRWDNDESNIVSAISVARALHADKKPAQVPVLREH
ncbi:hypothetical protein [Arthrobacter sp. SD76]|uniref:hypothetical protein n=1 Tax=Arthrobacter sp. SD76 TaxID=3415007 RepID=UPI003C730C57